MEAQLVLDLTYPLVLGFTASSEQFSHFAVQAHLHALLAGSTTLIDTERAEVVPKEGPERGVSKAACSQRGARFLRTEQQALLL